MTGLEALFNIGQPELSYTISRNIAVLLGIDKDDSNKIFQEMKDLYKKRSKIIHGSYSKNIGEEDLFN